MCLQYVDYSEFDHKLIFIELLKEKRNTKIKNSTKKINCIDYNKIETNILLNVNNVMSNFRDNIF